MQVTPVLPGSLDLHARLRRKPVHLLGIGERHGREIDLRTERLQADILQRVRDSGFNLRDGPSLGIDPCHAGELERILSAAQGQGSRRLHPPDVLEANLLEGAAANRFLSRESELEGLRIKWMKYQKQCGEAITQQHRSILAIALRFMDGN